MEEFAKASLLLPGVGPRRPRIVPQDGRVLVILGDFDHFCRSTISKLVGRTYAATPADAWTSDGRTAAFLKWTTLSNDPIPASARARVPEGVHVINDTHFNSDKRNVHTHVYRVFGYSAAVSPLVYSGAGVIKSNRNARHDGRVVQFPLGNRQFASRPPSAHCVAHSRR